MKKLVKILPVMMVMCLVLTSVYAIPTNLNNLAGSQSGANAITGATQRVWATVITIVQILAVAAVVFAGLRYMFASADQKADIKKSMGTLAIGAVLVFGATLLINFISSATTQIIK